MLEAKCSRCGETFNPDSTDQAALIHGECGGIGVIQGQWNIPGHSHLSSEELNTQLTPQERHGLEEPNCSSPDCEFHHPEERYTDLD